MKRQLTDWFEGLRGPEGTGRGGGTLEMQIDFPIEFLVFGTPRIASGEACKVAGGMEGAGKEGMHTRASEPPFRFRRADSGHDILPA